MDLREIRSPCLKKCVLEDNNVCGACKRTLQEITNWTKLKNSDKKVIWERIKKEGYPS
jgi:hypothetical protein